LVSTNSALLPALEASFGAVALDGLIRDAEAGRVRSLFVIGLDPLSMLPAKLWQALSDGAELSIRRASRSGARRGSRRRPRP